MNHSVLHIESQDSRTSSPQAAFITVCQGLEIVFRCFTLLKLENFPKGENSFPDSFLKKNLPQGCEWNRTCH